MYDHEDGEGDYNWEYVTKDQNAGHRMKISKSILAKRTLITYSQNSCPCS